jgi:hypothetical protein
MILNVLHALTLLQHAPHGNTCRSTCPGCRSNKFCSCRATHRRCHATCCPAARCRCLPSPLSCRPSPPVAVVVPPHCVAHRRCSTAGRPDAPCCCRVAAGCRRPVACRRHSIGDSQLCWDLTFSPRSLREPTKSSKKASWLPRPLPSSTRPSEQTGVMTAPQARSLGPHRQRKRKEVGPRGGQRFRTTSGPSRLTGIPLAWPRLTTAWRKRKWQAGHQGRSRTASCVTEEEAARPVASEEAPRREDLPLPPRPGEGGHRARPEGAHRTRGPPRRPPRRFGRSDRGRPLGRRRPPQGSAPQDNEAPPRHTGGQRGGA